MTTPKYTTDDFDFELPPELIAQQPVSGSRDQSRLMVLNPQRETITHRSFFELPTLLAPDDVLVLNDSQVFPARLHARKPTGGAVEVLLLRPRPDAKSDGGDVWEVLTRGKVREGLGLEFAGDVKCRLLERAGEQTWLAAFNIGGTQLTSFIDAAGQTPIPPYIADSPLSESALREQYQNVYARERGSAAAPTAGLHFTPQLLEQLRAQGNTIVTVTLHVGLGTFAPVQTDNLNAHAMHSEFATVSAETARTINQARQVGKRIIAVGTTSVRTLESFMEGGVVQAGQKWTNIFITPGYTFQAIDGMITNFHTPRSTLLMLVSAFAGYDFTKIAYKEAVLRKYRFYSFGDAMLIL